jgi:hypothetical protein
MHSSWKILNAIRANPIWLHTGRKDVDRFHREFLIGRDVPVTDEPKECSQYWPGY